MSQKQQESIKEYAVKLYELEQSINTAYLQINAELAEDRWKVWAEHIRQKGIANEVNAMLIEYGAEKLINPL